MAISGGVWVAAGGFGSDAERARVAMGAPATGDAVKQFGDFRQEMSGKLSAFGNAGAESAGVHAYTAHARASDLAGKMVAGGAVIPPRPNVEVSRELESAMQDDPALRASVRKAGEQAKSGLQVDSSLMSDIQKRVEVYRNKH